MNFRAFSEKRGGGPNLLLVQYFVVSIGITACSIIMYISLVIKTAERNLIYFVATKFMFLASYRFHFVMHLFSIK